MKNCFVVSFTTDRITYSLVIIDKQSFTEVDKGEETATIQGVYLLALDLFYYRTQE